MANVITQVEMMKYRGSSVAVFPEGTILTPSAKDWAKEQGIEVTFGGASEAPAGDELLDSVVKAVVGQFRANGRPLDRDAIVTAAAQVLERLEAAGH